LEAHFISLGIKVEALNHLIISLDLTLEGTMNIQSNYVSTMIGLFGVIVIGVSTGGLLSSKLTIVSLQLQIFDQIRQFWPLLIPILSFSWFCCLVGGGILTVYPKTRAFGSYWLTVTVGTWLCFTVVTAAVQISYGTAYTSVGDILVGSTYLATGLSFGCILTPLLLVRLLRFWSTGLVSFFGR
jgi:hypothetical protein